MHRSDSPEPGRNWSLSIPWMDEPFLACPALAGTAAADVAIVGGGYTGLSTALALRAAGMNVAVLEREVAGFGASGRNAGHLTPTIGKDLPTLLRVFGKERARALVALAEAAVRHVERTITELGIDCEYDPAGNIIAAVDPRQHRQLERATKAAAALGAKVSFLSDLEMRRRGVPRAFTCGVMEGCGGTLHPGRYVRGLRQAALGAGVRLYENTPVLGVEQGRRVTLRTAHGKVEAERLVLATNAFTAELGWLRHTVVRLAVSLFETAPLSVEQREAIGWRGHEGIYTAHESLESYRLTARGTIVGGAKYARYGFGGRATPDAHPPTFTRLEAVFRDRFPELRGLPIMRFWSGPIAFTLDFLPSIGRGGKHGNIYYGVAYAGHGLALASHAGSILADLILERADAAGALVQRFHPPLPPEPLRWLLVQGINSFLMLRDRRTDRLVRRRGKNGVNRR